METLREVFLNSANPAVDPETYLEVIAQILDTFAWIKGTKKLIVNTCGWVEGLGAEIQTRILLMIKSMPLSSNGNALQVISLQSNSKTSGLVLPHTEWNHITVKGDLPLS